MSWMSCMLSNVVLASLLALTAWFVQRWLRSYSVARILWVLVLVKLVTPPIMTVPIGESTGALACDLGVCGCGTHSQFGPVLLYMAPLVLLAIWSTGAIAAGFTAWRRWARFQRLLAHASPAPPQWQRLAARIAGQLSLRAAPEILTVPGRVPPLVVPGRRRPRIVLPRDLICRLDASQRVALLLHEMVHVKRRDHLVRILEVAVGAVYWWLPFAGLIGRQLRTCEESCCDAAVVARLPQARWEYARLLLDVFDFANPLPAAAVPHATAMSVADDLELRLRAILESAPPARRNWPAVAFAAAAACAILPCGIHYGSPAWTSVERVPASEAIRPPVGDLSAAYCCPS